MKRVWGKTLGVLTALGAIAWPGVAIADRVELANGDTLTGTIVEQTDQGVTLDHAVLGRLVLAADRVANVSTDPPADESAQGPADPPDAEVDAPNTPPADDAATPDSEPDAQPGDPAQPVETMSALQSVLAEWNSRLTLGLSGASGNTDRQDYRLRFQARNTDELDRWDFNAQWYYAFANGVQTQNQFETTLTRDWLQGDSPWFFFLRGHYQYDTNRSWENRTSAFGGGGYTITKTDDVEVNTRLGFGGTYEYGSVNEFTPEALFGGSVIQWDINDRQTLSGELTYYPSLEDTGNFRIESRLEWQCRLDMAEGLSLKLGVENEYDSQTTNDNSNNELQYFAALVFSF